MLPSEPFLNPNVIANLTNPVIMNELQRLGQLTQVVLSANPPVSLVAPTPAFLGNENHLQYRQDDKRYDHTSGRCIDRTSGRRKEDRPVAMPNEKNAHLHLRKPPPVSGGRGFFQDFPEGSKDLVNFNEYEDHSNAGRSWFDKDKRVVAVGETSSDGFAKPIDVNREISSNDFDRPSRRSNRDKDLRGSLKRRSNDDSDGDRRAKEVKREKQVYCGTQLRLGECHHSFCRLVHLTPTEMEEVYLQFLKIMACN